MGLSRSENAHGKRVGTSPELRPAHSEVRLPVGQAAPCGEEMSGEAVSTILGRRALCGAARQNQYNTCQEVLNVLWSLMGVLLVLFVLLVPVWIVAKLLFDDSAG